MAFSRGSSHRQSQNKGPKFNAGAPDRSPTSSYIDSGEMNANLSERIRAARFPNTYHATTTTSNNGLMLDLNLEIRNYFHKQDEIKQTSRSDAWLSAPEIPTYEELGVAETSVLPNKIDGPYKNKEKYLKVQYSLLREDAVGSLRDAILDFQKDPSAMDTAKFSIYDQVRFAGFTFARRGLAARIRFTTNRAGKRVAWQSTKRLTSGSLVALVRADDQLEDLSGVITAVVAARPLAGVVCEPPEIDIYLSRPEDLHVDPQEEWLMIEAKQGYFEAYRHTLKALQKLHSEKFPLSENICQLQLDLEPPDYIQQRPILNLSAAAGLEQKAEYSNVDVRQSWPTAPNNTLDESQWQAFREIFSRSLSIIQGPPGTGKTHVSKIAIQSLQDNRLADDPPLIIAAQTNHALDQLLGHVARFEPNYIRLGGRSTNPEVKKRALFEIRQQERIKQIPGGIFGKTNSLLDKQTKALISILDPLTSPGSDPFSTDQELGTQVLLKLGVLNTEQAKSLEDGATQWVSTTPSGDGPFQTWLDGTLVRFEAVYRDDNYGFEEVEDEDLEFEQLRETEDSAGINDEEDIEMLKGAWAPIHDHWTVNCSSSIDFAKAEKLFATTNDLWRVPNHLRGPMFLVLRSKFLIAITNQFRVAAKQYAKLVKDSLIGKWEQDHVYLKRARIIGMTTTGLSKYRALIAALKPRTILIEEAAEVLEAPVTVACIESLQHLILVGDHQQLRGHCSVPELEDEPFNLNMSLFERLVRNNLPFKTLLCQRRMNPEFRRLVSSIYPTLTDHASVVNRRVEPWGMGTVHSFFFDHTWSEYKDASFSTYNEEEARFIAGFYRHLQKNGITPERITILTFYNGQRKRILKELKALGDIEGTYHNVKTVDSYQGEENDIVILSMVRSNEDGRIGFLANENRVTVALSRAKYGFYLFGNAQALCNGSALWVNVATLMSALPRRLHHQLPLRCKKHHTTLMVQYPEDFHGTEGGCRKPCGEKLACNHLCPLPCHPYSHDKVQCKAVCRRELLCGHACEKDCSEECFCRCTVFSETKRVELDKALMDLTVTHESPVRNPHGSQDIRGPNFRVQDGQSYHPPQGSASYLPAQVPALLDSPSIMRGRNPTGRDGFTRPSPSKVRFSPPKEAPRYPPTPAESSRRNPMPVEAQNQMKQGWNTFAKGGVKADDHRRAQSIDLTQFRQIETRSAASATITPSPIARETAEVVDGGRMRFTQDFCLRNKMQSKPGDDSGHAGGRNVAEQEAPMLKDPAYERKRKMDPPVRSTMDDLAELDEYFRNAS